MLTFFPNELVVHILEFLESNSLRICQQVSRFFRDLIASAASLQYVLALEVAGLKNGRRGPGSADRLKLLQGYSHAWTNLEHSSFVDIPHLPGRLYELCDGVLAQGQLGGFLLHFTILPSTSRKLERRDWTTKIDDIAMKDFTICPAYDLVVIVSPLDDSSRAQRIHLRTMSTGSQHPDCREGSLTVQIEDVVSYSIQTSDEYLGILFCRDEGSNALCVWAWKTGKLEMHITDTLLHSFIFLTSGHVLLSTVHNDPMACLVAINFKTCPPNPQSLSQLQGIVHTFFMPSLRVVPVAFDLHCDSAPTSDSVPFYTADEWKICIATLWTPQHKHFAFVIPLATFISHLSSNPSTITWAEWGPYGSRMFPLLPGQQSTNWVCCSFGAKYVLRHVQDEDPLAFTVYDFNQLSVRKALHDGKTSTGTYQLITYPHHYRAYTLFQEIVVTHLPYQAKTLPLRRDILAVMISADSLLFVDSKDNQYHVLSF